MRCTCSPLSELFHGLVRGSGDSRPVFLLPAEVLTTLTGQQGSERGETCKVQVLVPKALWSSGVPAG